jgi:hypothetical protein
MADINVGGRGWAAGFSLSVLFVLCLFLECTMADVAFVVTTIAVFAVVALVARAVTKL